ncbi:flagellar filament capping protein FliD [Spirochaetota bacterium]
MSDISIPGVKSKYETEKLVESLMKLERVPKQRAEERLSAIEKQRSSWMDLNRRFSSLRESSRSLYSFQNPFNERNAVSSDESVLSATASREAIEETKSFIVKRTAAADRFMSDPIKSDSKIASGSYVFSIGETSIKLNYSGGSLKDFAEALNKKASGNIRAQLINVKAQEQVLVIESLKTGRENRLGFLEDAEKLALNLGLVEKASSSARELGNKPQRFVQPIDLSKVREEGTALYVGPRSEAAIKLPTAISSSALVLEMEVEFKNIPKESGADVLPPPGPSIPSIGGMDYEGIHIESAPSDVKLPEWTAPSTPPVVDDFSPLFILDGSGRAVPMAELSPSSGYKSISVPLALYSDSFSGLGIRNSNTDRELRVRSVRVYDPEEIAGFRPKNPVETAKDALIVMEGIEISRPSNTIDDLVPGLSLNLWNASEAAVKLKIEPDREAVKEALIGLVGNYNRLMAELNILSRNDDKILDEIAYFTDEEKKSYKERLGLFAGDTTLNQLRSTMQRNMMDLYPTNSGVKQLNSFGISTDSRTGGSYDASRLRGYLEIDEKILDKALLEQFQDIKETFGNDTDGDLIVDSGVAYKLDNLMKAYVETGGIVTIRTRTLDDQISRQKREIDNLETQLVRKEADLKRKYGLMESALGQMESSASAWDSFNKSQGN